MARAKWKFLPFTDLDIKRFYCKQIKKKLPTDNRRNKTLTMLNFTKWFSVHQGKTYVAVKTNEFTLNKKLGMFAKTRKPFFFRPKIKKKKK